MKKNYNSMMAASEQMSNEIVTSNNNENLMKKENTKSAGISHHVANMANLGNNIDENELINRMNYLNEKVTYEIEGFSGKFETCRWMYEVVERCATKAQFKSFSYLTRIAWNWGNFYGYCHRLMCAPEEAGMLRKDLRNIKALMKTVRFSFTPYRNEFLSRMEPLVEEFTKMHNEYGKSCEIINAMH